jgi:hypothetical protein
MNVNKVVETVATHGHLASLYYWFLVGEGTLPLHHLIAHFTPNKKQPSDMR